MIPFVWRQSILQVTAIRNIKAAVGFEIRMESESEQSALVIERIQFYNLIAQIEERFLIPFAVG